jgi:RNA polymerase sigma-70 factor (ECF subfamily)
MTADPTNTASDPERWLDEHGDHLYRYALSRTSRPEVAEDLVQETLLAALKARDSFVGGSTERTWLIAIMKRKMIDWVRRSQRLQFVADLESSDPWMDSRYDRTNHLSPPPGDWGGNPAMVLERKEFWLALEKCQENLPERLRLIFRLRVLDEVPANDLCASLEITPANLWTLLHRARLRLWSCLDRHGFAETRP